MKKGDISEGIIERVDFPNKGRVHTEEGTVTIKNGIPGQKVCFQINKKRKNQMEGRLLEVLQKSPLKKEIRSAAFSHSAAAACIRRCCMKTSWQ